MREISLQCRALGDAFVRSVVRAFFNGRGLRFPRGHFYVDNERLLSTGELTGDSKCKTHLASFRRLTVVIHCCLSFLFPRYVVIRDRHVHLAVSGRLNCGLQIGGSVTIRRRGILFVCVEPYGPWEMSVVNEDVFLVVSGHGLRYQVVDFRGIRGLLLSVANSGSGLPGTVLRRYVGNSLRRAALSGFRRAF